MLPANFNMLVIKAVLMLGILIALIFILAHLYRRIAMRHRGRFGECEILSVLPLGTRERAILVRVQGQQMLLGVTAQAITLLCSLNPEQKQE